MKYVSFAYSICYQMISITLSFHFGFQDHFYLDSSCQYLHIPPTKHSQHSYLSNDYIIFHSVYFMSQSDIFSSLNFQYFLPFFVYTTYQAFLQNGAKQALVRLLFLLLSPTNQKQRQQPMKSGPLSKTEFTPYFIPVNNNW